MTRNPPRNPALSAGLWLGLGLTLGILVFLDPFGWHSLDDRLRGDHAAMPGSSVSESDEILFYRNPMDPTITSPEPMQDEMGMDYIPVRASDTRGAIDEATVVIDPVIAQNMNVRTETAEQRDIERRLRSVGTLEFDQERMITVTTKYPGWVEKVYTNYVGQAVRRGAPLFEIYSPELVQTQQELLSALDYAASLAGAPEDTRARAEALADAARTRLSYWDIGGSQVESLEQTGEVFRTLKVVSPANGVVMKRQAGLEGMAVSPGMELFHIADLSSLWLSVELFEDQLAWIREGTEAEFSLTYFPGRTFRGVVRYIEPEVSEQTRTLGVKIEVPNQDRTLRPGMFATIVFRPLAAAQVLTVPTLAVIRTGQRNLVIEQLEAGRFMPREVTLGHQGGGYVQVLDGLVEGALVVTSAQFLLDSEANLQEAIQKMLAGSTEPAEQMEGHSMEAMEMPAETHDMHDMDSMAPPADTHEMHGMTPKKDVDDEHDHPGDQPNAE